MFRNCCRLSSKLPTPEENQFFIEYEQDLLANLNGLLASLQTGNGFAENASYRGEFRRLPKKLRMADVVLGEFLTPRLFFQIRLLLFVLRSMGQGLDAWNVWLAVRMSTD